MLTLSVKKMCLIFIAGKIEKKRKKKEGSHAIVKKKDTKILFGGTHKNLKSHQKKMTHGANTGEVKKKIPNDKQQRK